MFIPSVLRYYDAVTGTATSTCCEAVGTARPGQYEKMREIKFTGYIIYNTLIIYY